MLCFSKYFGHRSKTLHWSLFSLRSNPYLYATQKRTERKNPLCSFWRRQRDSNPRGIAPKRFSRPPRYDHFDMPAYYFYAPFPQHPRIISQIFLFVKSYYASTICQINSLSKSIFSLSSRKAFFGGYIFLKINFLILDRSRYIIIY